MHLDVTGLQERADTLSVFPMGDLLTAHGLLATNYTIEAVKWHTIDEFKKDVVPTLQSSAAEGPFSFFVIRDLSNGRLLSVVPDGVTELKVSQVADFPASEIYDTIKRNMERYNNNGSGSTSALRAAYTLNSSIPVFDYAEYMDGSWSMTVKVPETKIHFNHSDSELSLPIYFPPCLYTLHMNENNVYIKSRIAILMQDSISTRCVKLCRLPLPNISYDGAICIGNVTLNTTTEEGGTRTKTELITMALDMFLNSRWNYDYMATKEMPSNIDAVIEELLTETNTKKEDFPELNAIDGIALKLGKMLFVLRHEGAWERLDLAPISIEDFLRHEIRS